jgi:hypothetical protein
MPNSGFKSLPSAHMTSICVSSTVPCSSTDEASVSIGELRLCRGEIEGEVEGDIEHVDKKTKKSSWV